MKDPRKPTRKQQRASSRKTRASNRYGATQPRRPQRIGKDQAQAHHR